MKIEDQTKKQLRVSLGFHLRVSLGFHLRVRISPQ